MRRVTKPEARQIREFYLDQPTATSRYRDPEGGIDPYLDEPLPQDDSYVIDWHGFPSGAELVRACARVLQADRVILVYQTISVVACVTALYLYLYAMFPGFDIENIQETTSENAFAFKLFAYYLFAFMVLNFFTAASVVVATIRLRGNSPKSLDGMEAASRKLLPIFQWAGVSALVGIGLVALRTGTGGSVLLSAILGFAWSVSTYFVVPVLLFEEEGPIYAALTSFLKVMRIGRRAIEGEGWPLSVLTAFGVLGLTTMLPAGVLLGGPITLMLPTVALLSAVAIIASSLNSVLAATMYGLARMASTPRQANVFSLVKTTMNNLAEDMTPQPAIVDETQPHVETTKYLNRMRKS